MANITGPTVIERGVETRHHWGTGAMVVLQAMLVRVITKCLSQPKVSLATLSS